MRFERAPGELVPRSVRADRGARPVRPRCAPPDTGPHPAGDRGLQRAPGGGRGLAATVLATLLVLLATAPARAETLSLREGYDRVRRLASDSRKERRQAAEALQASGDRSWIAPITDIILPATLTTWNDWRTRHPDTTVMKPDRAVARQHGFRYQEGFADRARRGVAFPVWQKSDTLERNTEVYALRIDGHARVWPVKTVLEERVINDVIGDTPVVLVGDPESGAVRAYERRAATLGPGDDPSRVIDEVGHVWSVEEEFLEPPAELDARRLPRLAGHVAFWFGWYAFYPDTEVYSRP